MSCCPVTAEPARNPSDHTGVMKKAGNTNIYVTGPASAKAGVIAYPDIYGLDTMACAGAHGWVPRRLHRTDPVVMGHVSFHPAWIVENVLNGDGAVDKLAERVKVPQLLIAAGDDPDFIKPDGSLFKILKSRVDIGSKSDVLLFADEKHGWVHRGDLDNAATKTAVMKAWHTAVKFIQTNCPV
ncbi:unnamed protein product [Peronospora destructor]|uniref:Dienelactone hydrolase domain-containing protein n=1 Tax=Peronospora destructor TaxID=86335 RepID=A0AAV0TMI7_9STRA|nr:unnamed protein product [Peronospora destructor]